MVRAGERAPEFTKESRRMPRGLTPEQLTSACTEELCTFRDAMARFDSLDAQVYGLSVDLPFPQNS